MQTAPQARIYGRDFRPRPQHLPLVTLSPVEQQGWKVGRHFFPAPADKTSDAGEREYAVRCDEIRTRQWRDLDASTVGDIAHDERLAEALRAGASPAVLGTVLLGLVNERIEAIVRANA